MDNCCRLCCQQEGEMLNIFSSCEGLPVAVIIMIICPVKIQKNDNLSKLVCVECLEVVTSAYQLRELSNNNDRKFRSLSRDDASEENDNASEQNDDAFEEYEDDRPLFELKMEHIETTKAIAQKTAMTKIENTLTTTKIPTKNLAINKPRTSHAHFKVGKRRLKRYQKLKKTMACLWCKK